MPALRAPSIASSQGQTANRVLIHVDTELGAGYAGTAYRTRHDAPICVTRIFSSHEGGQSLPDPAQGNRRFSSKPPGVWRSARDAAQKSCCAGEEEEEAREEVTASLAAKLAYLTAMCPPG